MTLKFPGIRLDEAALKLRAKADEMEAALQMVDQAVKLAPAGKFGASKLKEINDARACMCNEINKIERQIILT
jgi:hypothetical protein